MLSLDELEAAIARDPEDAEVRRVYADGLQECGDPRGEHIALAFFAAKGDPQAAARVRVFEREAAARLAAPLNKKYVVRLHWRLGFVEHVDIDSREGNDKMPRTKLRELIEQRELLPLRSLDLRGIWNTEWSVSNMIRSLPELVAGRPVRWLGIGDGPIDDSHVEGLRAAMPLLDGLGVLTTKPRALLPALRGFKDVEIATRKQDSRRLVHALPGALSPDLERLVIHGMDDEITVAAFESLLTREVFQKLRHFGVFAEHELTFELLKALFASKLWPNLASFGMCCAELWDDDDTETWVAKQGEAFAHLRLFTSTHWPDDDDGHESGRLGLILKSIDRAAEAVPEIEHHLQFSGDDPDHYGCWEELAEAMVWAGWPEEALAPLDRGLEKFKNECDGDSVYTFRTRAEALDALGRWEESLAMCVQALECDEENSWTCRHMGRALRELHRYPEALLSFDKAILHAADEDEDERPDVLGWAYVERGRTLWQMRRIDEALRAFANARKKGEATAARAAWWAEGSIEVQRGRLAEARDALERAAEGVKASDLETPLYELGEVQFLLGDLEGALATWRKGAAMFDAWLECEEQAQALLALGRPLEALAATEGARRESGGARALALHALGRTGEAIVAVEDLGHRAGLHEPVCAYRHVAGPLIQAALHRASGREDAAQELFQKARRTPHDPRALHAAIVAELGEAKGCDPDLCGRPAAVVAIAAALALGDRDDAFARARALGAAVDAGSARLMPMRVWDVHGVLPLLEIEPALVTAALDVVERCFGGAALVGR